MLVAGELISQRTLSEVNSTGREGGFRCGVESSGGGQRSRVFVKEWLVKPNGIKISGRAGKMVLKRTLSIAKAPDLDEEEEEEELERFKVSRRPSFFFRCC